MSAKKPAPKKAPEPTEEESDPLAALSDVELAAYVAANPFAHLTHFNIRRLFKIGEKQMREVAKLHPPAVSGKINPGLFQKWLWLKREILALS